MAQYSIAVYKQADTEKTNLECLLHACSDCLQIFVLKPGRFIQKDEIGIVLTGISGAKCSTCSPKE